MTIGIIGCGKMAQALAGGAHRSGFFNGGRVLVYDPVEAAMVALTENIAAGIAESSEDVITKSDTLLLCVKPDTVPDILDEISTAGRKPSELLVISIAAGVTIGMMEEIAGENARFVRVMPNTPALVGEGAAAYSLGHKASLADGEEVEALLGSVGTVIHVKEKLMDAVTGLSGSGPAYVYTMIEALADGGLLEGLPRDQALALATQTVLGAAAMVRETGLLPADLRDRVTSPGGTTIAGLATLEDGAFRSTVIKAVSRAADRARELGQG